MFALSLSLKILTACLIQGVDKKRMKSTVSFAIECSLEALSSASAGAFSCQPFYRLCASKVCIPRVFYYYCFFSSILPKFSVYIYFFEDSSSVLYSRTLSQFTKYSQFSDLLPSRTEKISRSIPQSFTKVEAHLRRQVFVPCQAAANLVQNTVDQI